MGEGRLRPPLVVSGISCRRLGAAGGATRAFAQREPLAGRLAGGCEIRLRPRRVGEMSHRVFPEFRDRGYASRAVRLASDRAFSAAGVARIELHIEPDNAASRAVAQRAGLREAGVVPGGPRDVFLYVRARSNDPR